MLETLDLLWSSPGPGEQGGVEIWFVPEMSSVYSTSGWGIGYAAIGLYRRDADTGEPLAKLRTRSRETTALTLVGADLIAPTHKRLWTLVPLTLEERSQQDIPVAYPRVMAADEAAVALATWTGAMLLFVDRATGETVKRRVPKQPVVARIGDEWCLFNATEGGRRVVDLAQRTVVKAGPYEPLTEILIDQSTGRAWGRSAGRRQAAPYPVRAGLRVAPIDGDGPVFELDDEDERLLAIDGDHLWTCVDGTDLDARERYSVLRCRCAGTHEMVTYRVPATVRIVDVGSRAVFAVGGTWDSAEPQHRIERYTLPGPG